MNKVLSVFLLLILASCSTETKQEIAMEVPDSSLIAILTEAHLSDAAIYSGTFRLNNFTDNRPRILKSILARHQVSDSSFYRAIRELNKHPQQFQSIYQQVIGRLSSGESKFR